MKTVDELLIPRYKVMVDYPDSKLKVNSIITMWRFDDVEKEFFDNGYTLESFYQAYPHIFRKLQWWEERTEDEMPVYVKSDKSGEIFKWFYTDETGLVGVVGRSAWRLLKECSPATEEEYLSQKTKPQTIKQ